MKTFCLLLLVMFVSCQDESKKEDKGEEPKNPHLEYKEDLSKTLNEISGMVADGENIWAITDKPKSQFYKLDKHAKVIEEINIKDVDAVDVEAITQDSQYVYVGDIGDNEGDRQERIIMRVARGVAKEGKSETNAELIKFGFINDTADDKKKKNNYDCEAMIAFGDSLYLFTKRREDHKTELFSIPKTPGNYIAISRGTYDSKGLVTDAAVNPASKEIALIGYGKGHKFPFILFFKNFQGSNFFSGTPERIELADKGWDWQMEGIAYSNDGHLYFACEETKEVKSTFYAVKREKVEKLNKKKEKKGS